MCFCVGSLTVKVEGCLRAALTPTHLHRLLGAEWKLAVMQHHCRAGCNINVIIKRVQTLRHDALHTPVEHLEKGGSAPDTGEGQAPEVQSDLFFLFSTNLSPLRCLSDGTFFFQNSTFYVRHDKLQFKYAADA